MSKDTFIKPQFKVVGPYKKFYPPIGKGSYGSVHRGQDTRTGNMVALKILKPNKDGLDGTTIKEIMALQKLKHQNIIQSETAYLGYSNGTQEMKSMIQLPQCLSTCLWTLVASSANSASINLIPKYEKVNQIILGQILRGVKHMHDAGFLHRDLKPQNILIDPTTMVVKIADFGLSRMFSWLLPQTVSLEVQSLWFRAPEVLLGDSYYKLGIDTWAIGCIFYQLYEGKVLFQGSSEIEMVFKILSQLGTPSGQEWKQFQQLPFYRASFPKFNSRPFLTENMPDTALDLLRRFLKLDPKDRISLEQALGHPYFQN